MACPPKAVVKKKVAPAKAVKNGKVPAKQDSEDDDDDDDDEDEESGELGPPPPSVYYNVGVET